jgi:site-specific recombinase XerD
MKILEVFEQKLRYKNYSDKTIKTYVSYLKQFIELQNIKDPHQVSTKQISNFLENHTYKSISQQNQFIGCLKLFAKFILNKKDIHLSKIERPKSEKTTGRNTK